MYYLYILQCSDRSLYTGITTDVKRRVQEHNTSSLGAKYTRGRRPVKLVYTKTFRNRSTASQAESLLKKMSRADKLKFIGQ
jgi:putative endonuclease